MEKGVYIGIKNDSSMKGVFIPQEVQELFELNKRVQDRIDEKAKKSAAQARRAAKQEREQVRIARQSAALLGITAACGLAGYLDLMSYWLAWPVMGVCLVAVGVKLGKWKPKR